MSFRGDDQGRYGHVPPVQYPLGGQQQHQQQHQHHQAPYNQYPVRRPSFNNGDDTPYFEQGRQTHAQPHAVHHAHGSISGRGEDELFLSGPANGAPAPPVPSKPAAYGGPSPTALVGYQHQFQAQTQTQTQTSPSSYNPQAFARSQSQTLPYHPHPAARLASPTVSSFPSFPSFPNQYPNQLSSQFANHANHAQQSSPQSYTPAAYNPAAYAPPPPPVPQRTPTYASYAAYPPQPTYVSPTVPTVPTVAAPNVSAYVQNANHSTLYTPPTTSYQPSSYYNANIPASSVSPQSTYEPAQQQQQQQQHQPYGSGYSNAGSSYFPPASASPAPAAGAIPSTMTSQAPYPSFSQMPAVASDTNANTLANRPARAGSSASHTSTHTSTTPSPGPGLQRHPTNAPLPSRPPMDDLHENAAWGLTASDSAPLSTMSAISHDRITQDSLFSDIEADLGISPSTSRMSLHDGAQYPPTPGHAPGPSDVSDDDRYHEPSRTSSVHPSSGGWSVAQSDMSDIGRTPSTASTAPSAFAATAGANAGAAPSSYQWEDDSDPEGAFGVYEMQQADLNAQRFSIGGSSATSGTSETTAAQGQTQGQTQAYTQQPPLPPHHEHGPPSATPMPQMPRMPDDPSGSDIDLDGMDIGLYSGGYAGNLAYGGHNGSGSPPLPHASTPRPYEADGNYAPFPHAEMDGGGTGGLQPPTVHRLSFDDGDEQVSVHSGRSGAESPSKEEYGDMPDMFYHPGLSSRPLPAIPDLAAANLLPTHSSHATRLSYQQHSYTPSTESRLSYLPVNDAPASSEYEYGGQLAVERATSLSLHSTTPAVHVPGRSRTDAAEERRKNHRHVAVNGSAYGDSSYSESGAPSSMAYDVITLPTGRRKKFVPAKLAAADLRRCTEPWALSSIAHWVREMADGEPDLKRKTIEEGLVALFTGKVPNMNVADAETLAANVADSMFAAGILIPEEEWVKFGPGAISGVLWQLTGAGCYAPRLHETGGQETGGRCYSHYCTRTLKKANLDAMMSAERVRREDWVSYYKITKAVMEAKPRKEIERQNVLHEIVTSEEEYNSQLDVLRVLYKDQLRHWTPPIIAANRLDKFVHTVFGRVEAVQRVNKDHLLAQLKYRQNEQGPWISGFSDIFREWIRKAKDEYIAYSTAYPHASYTVRREEARNMLFKRFLDTVRNDKRSSRLGWDTFLKAPITRLQRYSLLLGVVLKNTVQDSEEKANLARAIEEIHLATKDCDRIVDEMGKKVSLQELQSQLVFRPGSQTVLNLDHLGRELLLQGELQRMGTKGVRWVDTHALLFDHYFILTKAAATRGGGLGGADKKFDVSKEPIPMPLLLLESMHDDPVSKQKGLTAPLARTTAASATDIRLNKVMSNGTHGSLGALGALGTARPELEHTTTSSSAGSGSASVSRAAPTTPGDEGKTLYPFRVKHLGHETYTLYTTTLQARDEWCRKIIEAKTRHARALLEQNAEPFRLRVLADAAFAYDSVTALGRQTSVSIRGTPLDRSIREIETAFGPGHRPAPVCRATVTCSAGFTAFGRSVVAVGTDFGVYVADATNPRGWQRTVQMNKVTQMAVLEEFSVCLVLADKALIAYPLDVVAPVSSFAPPTSESPRRAPQRLAKDVSFFAIARMKDRTLLFYKRKEGMHNSFKVLEPVFQKATEKKTRFFGSRRGTSTSSSSASGIESFRDFDEFYLPVDCYSLNLFQTYVAVSTAKGIEMLTLDRKQTMSVPRDLAAPATANIAARIRDQRPLGMFRLNDQEFLLAYEDCAVYADKHGEVSRTLIMEYSGKQKKARAATMYGQYLLLFNEDYVEVRNAENGRLRQIIAGSDVRCLDYGFRGPTGGDNASATAASMGTSANPSGHDSKGSVKICMSHPEVAGMQIVLELLLNDGHAEA